MRSLNYYSQSGNVGLLFYEQNRKPIEDVRKQLFANLRKYHPSISMAVQKLLAERIKNSPSPLLGELYPHIIINFLSDVDWELFKEISAQWLAAYVLTIMIDNSFDVGIPLNGALVAPLHLEALKLQKRITGTKYSALFERLVFEAVRGQIKDTKLQKTTGAWNAKLVTAKDKNKILCAFSTVIASLVNNQQQADFVTTFSENSLLTFQLLDDLGDLHTDYLECNNTILLSKINVHDPAMTSRTLLNQVISSGTMSKAILAILFALEEGIRMIKNNKHVINSGSSYHYFTTLQKEVNNLGVLIEDYRSPAGGKKKKLLGMIERQIGIVCQST